MSEPWLESQNACYAGIVNDGDYWFVDREGTPIKLTQHRRTNPKRVNRTTPPSCVVYHMKGTTQRFVGIAVDPIQYPCDNFSVQVSGVVDVQFKSTGERTAKAKMVGMDLDAADPERTARARVLLTPFRIAAGF